MPPLLKIALIVGSVIVAWSLLALVVTVFWARLKRAEPAMTDEHPIPRRRSTKAE